MRCTLSIVFPLLCLVAAALVAGCTKTPASADQVNTPNNGKFPEPFLLTGLDSRLQAVIRSLKASPDKAAIFARTVNRIGYPYWSKALVSQQGNTIVCLVPLKHARDSIFNAFTTMVLDTGIRLNTYHATALARYRQSRNSPSAAQIKHTLNALNHYGFGTSRYSTTGLSAAEIAQIPARATGRLQTNAMMAVTTCYSWATCAGDGAGNCMGQVYYFRECVTDYIWYPDGGDYSGGWTSDSYGDGYSNPDAGSGYTPPVDQAASAQAPPPADPVSEVGRYLACFDHSRPAKVIFYADQPTAGTTEPVSILGGIGHAWIAIEQQLPDGQLVRRSLGFYPAQKVNPFGNTSSVSVLGNDGGRYYDVKWEQELSAGQLQSMIQAATQAIGFYYDIEHYNCVNYVIDLAAAAGIGLPRSSAHWIVGSGLNPGSFGEDLRQMPNSYGHGDYTPYNQGSCQ